MTRSDLRLLRRILWCTHAYDGLVGSVFPGPGRTMHLRVTSFRYINGEGWQITGFEYLDLDDRIASA